MRIKFVPTPVAAPAQPIVQEKQPQIPDDLVEDEEFKQYEEQPKVV